MEIKPDIVKEIEKYCKANDIEDVEKLVHAMLNRGFTIEKFGEHPAGRKTEVKEVVKEIEVEKIVEVVKEIEVEKIIKVSDDDKSNELLARIEELEDINIRQTKTIMALNKDIDELNEEFDGKLEEITKMITPPSDNDIYGDGKKGQWGSNLLDLFKRKKDGSSN